MVVFSLDTYLEVEGRIGSLLFLQIIVVSRILS